MSEPDLQALERRLRTLPPLLHVPPALVDRSLAPPAEDPVTPRRRRPRPRATWALALGGVAALLAVAAVALPGHTAYHRIANLTGAGAASGYVAVGPSTGATEPVVVSLAHLDPAPAGSYYQISFQTRGKPVPGAIFNAAANGTAVVHLNAPAHTKWVRCWVTRAGHVVMTGTSSPSA